MAIRVIIFNQRGPDLKKVTKGPGWLRYATASPGADFQKALKFKVCCPPPPPCHHRFHGFFLIVWTTR